MDKYKNAGVDVEKGYEVVQKIKQHVIKTHNVRVIDNYGGFASLYELDSDIKNPVLVSGCDGVGTKLLLAIAQDNYTTIGHDLVAMCINDIITTGARPLYFLDYIAVNKIKVDVVVDIVKSVADACLLADCALVGGETAEMGNLYQQHHFDLAGFATGVVDKDKIISKNKVKENDVIIGLPSSGLHSNGYSLINKMCDITDPRFLIPTKIYAKEIQNLTQNVDIHAIANITGGGWYENIPRALPSQLKAEIFDVEIPELFVDIQNQTSLTKKEMFGVFNMGIGMVVIVSPDDVDKTIGLVDKSVLIGEVRKKNEQDSGICFRSWK